MEKLIFISLILLFACSSDDIGFEKCDGEYFTGVWDVKVDIYRIINNMPDDDPTTFFVQEEFDADRGIHIFQPERTDGEMNQFYFQCDPEVIILVDSMHFMDAQGRYLFSFGSLPIIERTANQFIVENFDAVDLSGTYDSTIVTYDRVLIE